RETDRFRCFAPEGPGDYFHPWSNDVFCTTLETGATGLLLISDYRAKREPLLIERSNREPGALQLRDAFTGQPAASLQPGQWEFRIELPDSPVRLLTWSQWHR
ncbi:MAG: hypothetical protein HYU66_09020, partial [Armatimonadetes bacterium]|nr:hypothetical protein [Armatimonadota bacterium]